MTAHSDAAPTTKAPITKPERPTNNWHKDQKKKLTLGDRAADSMRNKMGSWGFVGTFLVFMIVWAIVNALPFKWDPYPYILLNLFLSMLAGLQGAILLIAAKRQDTISSALAEHDAKTNIAAKHEIEELMKINQTQLEMLGELRALLQKAHVSLDAAVPSSKE